MGFGPNKYVLTIALPHLITRFQQWLVKQTKLAANSLSFPLRISVSPGSNPWLQHFFFGRDGAGCLGFFPKVSSTKISFVLDLQITNESSTKDCLCRHQIRRHHNRQFTTWFLSDIRGSALSYQAIVRDRSWIINHVQCCDATSTLLPRLYQSNGCILLF
jgi:hypothetical protein